MKKQAVLDFEKELVAGKEVPDFKAGDTVAVHYKIEEGGKERIQVFKGVCLGIRGDGAGKCLTVRKLTSGFGVERVFPILSPFVDKIVVERRGKVKRGKLFYLRGRTGKAARIAEKIEKK